MGAQVLHDPFFIDVFACLPCATGFYVVVGGSGHSLLAVPQDSSRPPLTGRPSAAHSMCEVSFDWTVFHASKTLHASVSCFTCTMIGKRFNA